MSPRPIVITLPAVPNVAPFTLTLPRVKTALCRTAQDDDEDRQTTITDAIALLSQAEDALAQGLVAQCDQLIADAADLLLPVQA